MSLIEEQQVHLRDYIRIIDKRRGILVAAFLITLVTVAINNELEREIYEATAKLRIDSSTEQYLPREAQVQKLGTRGVLERNLLTHFRIIQSYPVAERVAHRLGMIDSVTPISPGLTAADEAAGPLAPPVAPVQGQADPRVLGLLGATTVETVRDTDILLIRSAHPNPQRAMQMANYFAEEYMRYDMDLRVAMANQTRNYLRKQLREEEKKVVEAEMKLLDYRRKEGIAFEPDRASGKDPTTMGDRLRISSELMTKRGDLIEQDTRLQELRRLRSTGGIGFTTLLGRDSMFQALEGRRMSIELELASLRQRYKDKHPEIVALRSELAAIEKSYRDAVDRALHGLQAQRDVTARKVEELEKTLKEFETKTIEKTEKDIEYQMLKRSAESARRIYESLLRKINELDVSANVAIANMSLVDPAKLPRRPVRPRKALNLMLGAVVGVALGVFLAFFLEYWDRTIRTPEDVERYLNLPVLSAIPIMETE